MSEKIRILIVDDHHVVRGGIRALLEAEDDIEIVDEAADGVEAVFKTQTLKPDVILMDLMMPNKTGIEAIEEIKNEDPDARILVLTSYSDDAKVFAAIKAGALGYLLKESSARELLVAIHDVYRGESSLHPAIARKLIRELNRPSNLPLADEPLTEREIEILIFVARGYSNQDIANALFMSERTVRTHVSNILSKLHLTNRTQAALYALKEGLTNLDEDQRSAVGLPGEDSVKKEGTLSSEDEANAEVLIPGSEEQETHLSSDNELFMNDLLHNLSNSIISARELVRLSKQDKNPSKYLEMVDTYLTRSTEVLQGMRNQFISWEIVNTDLTKVIKAVEEKIAFPSATKLIVDIPYQTQWVKGNQQALSSVFENLIINAIHATARSGQITLRSTIENDKWVTIRVADTGIGIEPIHHDKLFGLFFTTKENGHGMGLWLCKRIIDRLGGSLDLEESVPGKGSTFVVRLRLAPVQVDPNHSITSVAEPN